MEIIKKRIADMERAEYNPRVELMPGDDEYEKLKRNIDRFGVVVPVIWNKRTNRVVSGHQRLTVLMNEGVTETDVSVVDLDETAEFLSTPSARRATAKTETKSLFSNKLYNILHEFRRALIYNGSKSYPNHAK